MTIDADFESLPDKCQIEVGLSGSALSSLTETIQTLIECIRVVPGVKAIAVAERNESWYKLIIDLEASAKPARVGRSIWKTMESTLPGVRLRTDYWKIW